MEADQLDRTLWAADMLEEPILRETGEAMPTLSNHPTRQIQICSHYLEDQAPQCCPILPIPGSNQPPSRENLLMSDDSLTSAKFFCASRFEGEAQVWWDLQQRWYYSDAIGHWRYPLYNDFKKAVHDRFFLDANARLRYQALRRLHQTDFKSGNIFFQKFEELALEADIIDNEGQMAKMVEEAVRKTTKDTIYAQPNHLLDTYEEWKRRILQIDYNYHLNRATGGQLTNRLNNAGTSKGNSSATTSSAGKVPATGTTYGGQGQPMDIDAINNGKCFRCHEKGHISKNCLLQSWNKKKQEVRALRTKPSTGSKIEEVKDAAGK
ncbi:hypothetical protein ARMSODRAFT_976063 [Armillaria solidipes]|uniref:CCHC-type domain-containing protein n=1 Tax=Armillaria solidipes TaxID=1076256 RepID=A0A2H3BEW1_9AGAR|nr:hypothetical protein ARMSODRAFT_976063 [Armillaria solidipes]